MGQRAKIFEGLVGSDRQSWNLWQMLLRTTILLIRVPEIVRAAPALQRVGQIDPLLSSRGSQQPALVLPPSDDRNPLSRSE